MESSFVKSMDEIKLVGKADTPEGPGQARETANKNIMMFIKGKHESPLSRAE